MILLFPNPDTLRMALTSGAVPPTVSLAPAEAVFDADGKTWVQPSVPLEKSAMTELRRLGVSEPRASATGVKTRVQSWPQLLPLERDSRIWDQADRTPILFALTGAGQVPELVGEMLRLGNDRQSFRWLDADRALLRVIGPPYYSLLRALDGQGSALAYRELNLGVWVQIGFTHPLVEQIRPPAGQILLMQFPRQWTFIEEGRFRDIYDILDFALPQTPAVWRQTDLERRLTIPVRLARGGGSEPAEMWVLKTNDLAQLDNLVQNADDQLLARLAFAVGERDGQRTIVLRVRPSKLPPPVLVLDGIAFRPFLRLPNLFLPCGQRLHPPLRRDAVVKLLAGAARQITWLFPEADGLFTPESLPDEAFRPLSQWVDYVLDHDHEALTAWMEATRFDFEGFVCPDEQPVRKPAAPKEPTRPKKPRSDRDDDADIAAKGPAVEVVDKSRKRKKEATVDEMIMPTQPSELEKILRKLEQSFLDLKVPLDAPERQDLWPRMAQLNSALGHADDAAVCWGNALWERDEPPDVWLETWWQNDPEHTGDTPTASRVKAILGIELPRPADVRLLAIMLLHFAQEDLPAADLSRHLGKAQQFLEKHDALLGVRLAWLAWEALHRLAGGDVLALARARDRLLERLYLSGLSADLDLPGFLRFTGLKSSDRFRIVREQIVRLRPMVHQWLGKDFVPVASTEYYADLVFAFGLARLGETSECMKLLEKSKLQMQAKDIVHSWLFQAYEYRIRQALAGKTSTGPLPPEMLEALEARERVDELGLDPGTLKKLKEQVRLERYKIDRLRQQSRILEPHEKVEPYRRWHGRYADDLSRELAGLFDIHDRGKLADRLKKLLHPKARDKKPVTAQVLATALELAPRLGEDFSTILLEQVEGALEKLSESLDQALVLEKSLFLAAHYDKSEEVQRLVARFYTLLEGKGADLPVKNLESLLGNSFRSLRKLGLRDEVGKLLERMALVIEDNPQLAGGTGTTAINAARRQRTLLQVAGGWFFFGQDDRARPILDKARALLFKGELIPVEQTPLACAYVTTLGQAPMDLALPRITELFRKLKGVFDPYTTTSHYSLSRLNVVEAVVFALVNDDFTIAPEARRWLDDDEFLVRRRIHRQVRAAMQQAPGGTP